MSNSFFKPRGSFTPWFFNLTKIFTLISLVLLVALISFCNNPNKDRLFLFNKISFDLKKNESLVELDSLHKTKYYSYFLNQDIQIPLYRCIKTNEYTIFIGIPLNSSIGQLKKINLNSSLRIISDKSDSSLFFYRSFSNKTENVSIYSRDFDDNIVFVIALSKSYKPDSNYFDFESINTRFFPRNDK